MISTTKFVIQQHKFDGDTDLEELEFVAEIVDAEQELVELHYEDAEGLDVYISFNMVDLAYAAKQAGGDKFSNVEGDDADL